MSDKFPINDTLAGGTYRVTEHLLGSGSRRLCLGVSDVRPAERYFVSTMWLPRRSPEALRREIDHQAPGLYELAHVGMFDVRGDDPERTIQQEQHCALVEKLPAGDGDWLPGLVTAPLGARAAVELGLSVGWILNEALEKGILLGLSIPSDPFPNQRRSTSPFAGPKLGRHQHRPRALDT